MTDLAAMFGSTGVETFLGLPRAPRDAPTGRAAVLGVPGATPYASVGPYCAGAPAAIRAAIAPYAANLAHVDFDAGRAIFDGAPEACDLGDLPFDPADFAANRAAIATTVARIAAAGAVPVLLGGDDSVPIPMLQGLSGHGPLTVLQIDAHIDWREEVGGERFGLSSTMRRASEMAHVAAIVQVGARGIGSARPGDLADAEAWGARILTARAFRRDGPGAALAAIPEGARLVVALDLDALDPAEAPGVIGRAPGGLGYWDVVELIEAACARARLTAFSLVEYVPGRDVDGLAALTAARIAANVLRLAAAR